MPMLSSIAVWTLLYGICFGLEPFETFPDMSDEWTVGNVADPEQLIDLKVAVVNAQDAAFEEHAMKIATPFSGHYRKQISAAELADWVKPQPEHVSEIQQWLVEHEINSQQSHDLVLATTTIAKAQKLLNTTYRDYQHRQGRIAQRTHEYYIPDHLSQMINFVHPTVNLPHEEISRRGRSSNIESRKPHELSTTDLAAPENDPCNMTATTPACLNHLYNASYIAPYSSNITVANVESYGEGIYFPALELYLKTFNPLPLKRKNYATSLVISPKNTPARPDDPFAQFTQLILGHGSTLPEQCIDLNAVVGEFEWGPETRFNNTPKQVAQGEKGYLAYLHKLSHAQGVPSVVSQAQWVQESHLSKKYMQYLCKAYAQTSSRGITFIQQTTDGGTWALPNKKGIIVFAGPFPSTCPWVSGVGATVYDRGDSTEKAQTWQTRHLGTGDKNVGVSGGAFSQIFPRPFYQNASVPGYVTKSKLEQKYGPTNPNCTGFVGSGRAVPDFSTVAGRIPVVNDKKVILQNDCVLSTPIAAAFIGRLNAYEESKGRPPLGALNTFFYQNPDMFTDIPCCGNNGLLYTYPNTSQYLKVSSYGFPVAPGWDAVTGLGTFKFAKIQQRLDEIAAAGALR